MQGGNRLQINLPAAKLISNPGEQHRQKCDSGKQSPDPELEQPEHGNSPQMLA